MSFQSALSGLNSASKNLDVIGNNVANASVVGFKGSQAQFADVFANSLIGGSSNSVGIGSKVAAVAQGFSQGNISSTSNALDIAINGRGFYRMDDNGVVKYSRNGQFHFNNQGFIVNNSELKLTGYNADANGNIVTASPSPIQISFSDINPNKTTALTIGLNLDSREAAPPTALFTATDPTSYNRSTSASVFDTLGNPHVLTTYYVKNATANVWQVYGTIDGSRVGADLGAGTVGGLPAGLGLPVTLTFDTSGRLTTGMPLTASVPSSTGSVSPLGFTVTYNGSTQFGSAFGVNTLAQDGFSSGRLAGFSVGNDGIIVGSYTSGQTRKLGQVVLADFRNAQGLAPLGNNVWADTSASGLPIIGTPSSGSLGSVASSSAEDSNVDLTAELVAMITAQRDYQANAQTIKTQDAILQTLVNLR